MTKAPDFQIGKVTDDPAKSAPVGTQFNVIWNDYYPLIDSGAGSLGDEWTHFDTALLALCFGDGRTIRLDGSAVLIGPGLALAAKHVIEPILDALLAGSVAPVAVSVTANGIVHWRVHQIIRGGTDVAILRLDLASAYPPHGLQCATLSTRTPAVGEPVMIAGVRSEQVIQPGEPLGLTVRVGVGEVSDVYEIGRDRVLLPTPCVAVRCLTLGGMSGGPAFDKNGHLIGILTSSLEDDVGPSNVSLWWPTAADPIESLWPPGLTTLPTSLLELAQAGVIKIVGADALTSIAGGESNFEVEYRPWT